MLSFAKLVCSPTPRARTQPTIEKEKRKERKERKRGGGSRLTL
jgi:hypothetical protein